MDPLYTFDRRGMEALARDHRRLQHQIQNLEARLRQANAKASPVSTYLARTPTGGLPGVSGSTPGSANCEIYATRNGSLAPLGFVEQVKNWGAAAAANTYLPVIRDPWGDWWPTSSTTTRRAAYFRSHAMIRNETNSAAPALADDEVRSYLEAGVRFSNYTGAVVIGSQQAGDVEYLATSPVSDPEDEWDDPIIRFLKDGLYLIGISWRVRPSPNSQWSNSATAPYGTTRTTAAASGHTHDYQAFTPLDLAAILRLHIRDSGDSSWDGDFADSELWTPIVGYSASRPRARTTSMAMYHIPAGAELRLEASATAGSPLQSGYLVERMGLLIERVSDYAYNTWDRDLVVPATGVALPLEGDHTTEPP